MLHVHQECGEDGGEGEKEEVGFRRGWVCFLGWSKVFCDGNTSAWISIMRRREGVARCAGRGAKGEREGVWGFEPLGLGARRSVHSTVLYPESKES